MRELRRIPAKAGGRRAVRWLRSPDLLVSWQGSALVLHDLAGKKDYDVSVDLIHLLDAFRSPKKACDVEREMQDWTPRSVRARIRELAASGVLLRENAAAHHHSRLAAWGRNVASAQYLAASRDLQYRKHPMTLAEFRKTRMFRLPAPAMRKEYPGGKQHPLGGQHALTSGERALSGVLRHRRTVREFSAAPVTMEDVAAIVKGTWGQTGWIESGPMGRLVTKTSPSGGSRHPIECYVLSLNVRGLPKGVYHYEVTQDSLRLLLGGSFHRAVIRAGSGQDWIGNAAFVCVMTAVFERTLWKYDSESVLRVLWLDAGHLAQTFCLLATSRGLGPFTTAAIQESYIERLLGIEGIAEFPVYLCGAGIPQGVPGWGRNASTGGRRQPAQLY